MLSVELLSSADEDGCTGLELCVSSAGSAEAMSTSKPLVSLHIFESGSSVGIASSGAFPRVDDSSSNVIFLLVAPSASGLVAGARECTAFSISIDAVPPK
jgi:hypothetical protein